MDPKNLTETFRKPGAAARLLSLLLLCHCTWLATAQVFTGNNTPGTYKDFPLPISADTTNISLTLAGDASSFSYLLVKKGATPSDTDYDWSSRLDGTTNALCLERPEIQPGDTLVVRVETPANSQADTFSLLCEPNRTDLRSLARPVTKSLDSVATGAVKSGTNHYFRVELDGQTGLSIALDSTSSVAPDLYIDKGRLPTTSTYLRKSTGSTNNLIAITPGTLNAGVYYIGVFGASGTTAKTAYTLTLKPVVATTLSWDPGLTHTGTTTITNTTAAQAQDYYFRIITQNPAVGAWRTALRVLSGEADLYLGKGMLPTPTLNTAESERAGSDGVLLGLGANFQQGEEWYILVRAKANTTWSLVTGTPFVQDLGTVAADSSTGSGDVEVGPEGMRFFRAQVTTDMLAWRLWLNGQTNTLWLKRASVPLPGTGLWELTQSGQMLVVPPYLSAGSYYVGVSANPGTIVNLDNRQQPVLDVAYGSSTSCSATGFAYVTYRVQVPAGEIAWQLYVPSTSGNPNLAVRRNTVPNENNSDAVSELGGSVADNVTLVPLALGNGTYFVTVYSTNVSPTTSFSCTLQNGPAPIQDIAYHSRTLNDDPTHVGWRFYRMPYSTDQLNSLGWDLSLSNAAPGTRIALRQGNVPSIWTARSQTIGQSSVSSTVVNSYDVISTGTFLQEPDHQPDTWYIGVYNPTNALGAFTLISDDLTPTPLTDNSPIVRSNVLAGRWEFFSLTLSSSDLTGTNAILGWDLRLTNVTAGSPRLVVRKEKLPVSLTSTFTTSGNDWPGGGQWAPTTDWTKRSVAASGTNEDGRILAAGVGRPIVPGTYYIGVLNSTGTNNMSYSLLSRWIGVGRAIPVVDLDFATGRATNTLDVREAAYYRVNVPLGSDSWKVHLRNGTNGDTMMVVTTNLIPTIDSEKRVERTGDEWYVRVPQPGQTAIAGGTYFVAVIGEGAGIASTTKVGTGPSSYSIESLGLMPRLDLGTLDQTDIYYTNHLSAGEATGFQFHVARGCLGYWLQLEQVTGYPWEVVVQSTNWPDPGYVRSPGTPDPYGNEGGTTAGAAASPYMVTCASPGEIQTIVTKARQQGAFWEDADYVLHIKPAQAAPLLFDGGMATVTNGTEVYGEFFMVDVPTNALGWDLRLTNVTAGAPALYIAKATVPLGPPGFPPQDPYAATSWPDSWWMPGGGWAQLGADWTGKPFSASGEDETGRIWMASKNRPMLIPGRYFVQVISSDGPSSYTLVSRGIGSNFALPITALDFNGGQVTVTNLAPREAAYFKVTIPTNTPSWKVKVTSLTGESLLCVLKDTPPTIGARADKNTYMAGRKMQKLGDEYYLLLPPAGSDWLTPGDYYLSVVSEGDGTTAYAVGDAPSALTLTSFGQAPVTDFGLLGPVTMEKTDTNTLVVGDTEVYQFTIASNTAMAAVTLDRLAGTPTLTLRYGTRIPDPSIAISPLPQDYYGTEGGETGGTTGSTNAFSLPNPAPGTYVLSLKARGTNDAQYVLHVSVTTVPVNNLGFDPSSGGNSFPVSGQTKSTWNYWAVNVPTNAQGWDIRVTSVSGGAPKLVVKRGSVPTSLSTTPWSAPGNNFTWPTNNQWASAGDWTRRTYGADGVTSEDGRILAMGIYRPLEPGLYYVGVYNNGTTNTSYTLLSRGIGPDLAIPIVDLPYGGTVSNLSLAVRDAAYYRVVIPSNTPSLKLALNLLTNIGGECMLTGLRGALPNVSTISGTTLQAGKTMQKPGNEHYLLLPSAGQTNILASTNYFAVVSEGMNPSGSSAVGLGGSAYTLSCGTIQKTDLGLVTSEDIVQPDELQGGEVKAYSFSVFPGTYGVCVRLENRSGNPTVVAVQGDQLPDPGAGSSTLSADSYGNEGGLTPMDANPSILTLANPVPGNYTLLVKARAMGSTYPDAKYSLRVQEVLAPELNFSQEFNSNGLTNAISGLIQDNERAFFRIEIPATNNGLPVIGWRLKLEQTAGLALMRVRKDQLPADSNNANQMYWATASAIIAPPYLTNGTWFVEVKGSNTTAFTLTSSALTLERPAWVMPEPGQTNLTPGLTLPCFGDTGVDTNGVALSDPMTVLAQGAWHYYAVQIPSNNIGLLRAELRAGSGNPDLYLRQGFVPTLYHTASGAAGYIYDRSMAAQSDTEFANWVPLDGKTETQLKAGTWYLAVKAAGTSSAQYRLLVSVGTVLDIPLDGTAYTNQNVLGGDWCYYRFTPPTGIPLNLSVDFGRDYGDVVMQVRQGIPPGNGVSGALLDVKDWATDKKNIGPYSSYPQMGSYTLSAAPVRPGEVLYLGFRAPSRSTFSISVSNAAPQSVDPPVVPFYGGTAQTNIPAHSAILYRVDVPSEATRWKHTTTHSTNVVQYLDQGTLPVLSGGTLPWKSSGVNGSKNVPLVTWNSATRSYDPAAWPWLAGQSYYLLVTNVGAVDEAFSLVMDGRDAETDDNDNNGLPDAWEMYYFGHTGIVGTSDSDGDQVSNWSEYLEGTDPTNPKDFQPRLYIAAAYGTVQRTPDLPSYPLGSTVRLTPVPTNGYAFVGWSGDTNGSAAPLDLLMDSHKTLTALFKRAGDNFATALPLLGSSANVTASNLGFTRETGEPYHAGNYGGKSIWWQWTAPATGPVTLSTAGSSFTTLLAVYTGTQVNQLTCLGSDINSTGGTNRSYVQFTATAGTLYHIAVDGYNGASGSIALLLQGASQPTVARPSLSSSWQRNPSGLAITLHGTPSSQYILQSSTDLHTWTDLGAVTTDSQGSMSFTDPAGTTSRRFYRARLP